jgi:hypothetical protein
MQQSKSRDARTAQGRLLWSTSIFASGLRSEYSSLLHLTLTGSDDKSLSDAPEIHPSSSCLWRIHRFPSWNEGDDWIGFGKHRGDRAILLLACSALRFTGSIGADRDLRRGSVGSRLTCNWDSTRLPRL